ncbi:hypothetical protein FACS1894193_06860 [Bacilli bacterium]|nr:hypothetical protein FACS1894193_06860 [Bacilli bacterium]
MADKLKILMGLSALSSAASLYQILTHSHQFDRTFLIIYCVLIVIFNRDKALTQDKIARIVVIITLILLLVTSFLAR